MPRLTKLAGKDLTPLVRQYGAGKSASQLAKDAGVTCVTMLKWLRRNGVLTRTQREVASKLRKNGRWVDYRGYVRLLRPGHSRANLKGQVMEHFVVWE